MYIVQSVLSIRALKVICSIGLVSETLCRKGFEGRIPLWS